jgi:hypothetical protein
MFVLGNTEILGLLKSTADAIDARGPQFQHDHPAVKRVRDALPNAMQVLEDHPGGPGIGGDTDD